MSYLTTLSIKEFFTEIFNILKETDTNLIEIWLEISKLSFLNKYKKSDLKELIGNFEFVSLKKGNYQFYVVINKISFITDAIKILELDIRKISEILNYSGFETLVQEILSKHGYITTKNFRFSDKSNFKSETSQKRYEIDVIGIYSKLILLIDAKQWKRKDSFSSINKAANLQLQRAIALQRNPEILSKLVQEMLGNRTNLKKRLPFTLIPLMVTLEDNRFRINDNQIPLVSIYEMNSFLQELQNNLLYFNTIQIDKISLQRRLF